MPRRATSIAFDEAICARLGDGPMTTRELAGALDATHGKVYSHCRALETRGILTSQHTSNATLLYCIDDRRVVTGADYESCKAEGHELRSFPNDVRMWTLAP